MLVARCVPLVSVSFVEIVLLWQGAAPPRVVEPRWRSRLRAGEPTLRHRGGYRGQM